MSMKWVGSHNDNLHHDPSEKPRESPTAATVTERPSIYQAEAASIWPLATKEGDEMHPIFMMQICYENEVDWVPKSK